ncbi:MAG TPA: TIGR01777 family oxidoreductase [Solirubrobacteraceae bacterium]|nr:TIGR01777 family oxidoreductase [Solirubrobacteraceae bacterium]
MRITITGATGRLGGLIVAALQERGDELTVLSRNAQKARERLPGVEALAWDPSAGPAPTEALDGRDAIVHLAGEDIAQRWNDEALRRIRESREIGTRNLVQGIAAADPRPKALVSAAAVGYYGNRHDPVDEDAPPGDDVLADICAVWEREAARAADLGLRVARIRTGVVLDRHGGALQKMLLPFRLGVGGPVAGGHQPLPWIHLDDVVGIYLQAIDDDRYSGPINATAPTPATNREFSKALGRALKRPAITPVPAFALRLLYGGMAKLVVEGQCALPRRALELGYEFRHPDLDEALQSALRET